MIRSLHARLTLPWCIIGDFNDHGFRSVLSDCSL